MTKEDVISAGPSAGALEQFLGQGEITGRQVLNHHKDVISLSPPEGYYGPFLVTHELEREEDSGMTDFRPRGAKETPFVVDREQVRIFVRAHSGDRVEGVYQVRGAGPIGPHSIRIPQAQQRTDPGLVRYAADSLKTSVPRVATILYAAAEIEASDEGWTENTWTGRD